MNEHQVKIHRVWALCVTIVLTVALLASVKGCEFDRNRDIALAEQGFIWTGSETEENQKVGGWRRAE